LTLITLSVLKYLDVKNLR